MRVVLSVLLSATLMACNGPQAAAPATSSGPCDKIQPILDARSEPLPFASLRGENIMLGDWKLDDKFVSRVSLLGGQCEISVMGGVFGDPDDVHIFNCALLQQQTSFNKDETASEAERLFAEAETLLKTCLGSDFDLKSETDHSEFDPYRKTVFQKRNAPVPESGMIFYDAYVEMSYSPFMRGRGGPSGWLVEVQFQETRPAEKSE